MLFLFVIFPFIIFYFYLFIIIYFPFIFPLASHSVFPMLLFVIFLYMFLLLIFFSISVFFSFFFLFIYFLFSSIINKHWSFLTSTSFLALTTTFLICSICYYQKKISYNLFLCKLIFLNFLFARIRFSMVQDGHIYRLKPKIAN